MPMNGTQLGSEIVAALGAAGLLDTPAGAPPPTTAEVWEVIASAIVTHIQTQAVVTTTVAAAIPVQVTPATGTGATIAPGAGTGTVA